MSLQINTDIGDIVGRAGQFVTLASDHNDTIGPNRESLVSYLLDDACFGNDKFGDRFKANMQPEEAIEGMTTTRKISTGCLTDVGVLVKNAASDVGLTDLRHRKEIEKIEPGSAQA